MANWGIISCGKVSHDFCTALRYKDSPHKITAVATRNNLAAAQEFAQKHNASKAYGNYAELIADADVQVIYIGTLHVFHVELAKQCFENGKHVLCEKPLALNGEDAAMLFDLAKQKNLFFMEGMWSRFTPAYKEIMRIVNAGEIGQVTAVSSSFSFDGSNIPRITDQKLGGGGILDIGIYATDFCLMAFGDRDPDKVDVAGAFSKANGQGAESAECFVDTVANITMHFNGRGSANAFSCTLHGSKNFGCIMGTKGSIRCAHKNAFHSIYEFEVTDFASGKTRTVSVKEKEFAFETEFNYTNSSNFAFEADAVAEALAEGRLECPEWDRVKCLRNMGLVDKFYEEMRGAVRR